MTREELSSRITQVVARVARVADPKLIELDKDLYRDIGVKSTAALDLLLSLEEEFGVSIPDQAFGDARTVGSLVALIGELQ
ncbi:MAG TPA: acyl carrier protein [Geminicoccaceae bacterium]|nr:acyl carrier protein [Geminicoccaceae bacterium]